VHEVEYYNQRGDPSIFPDSKQRVANITRRVAPMCLRLSGEDLHLVSDSKLLANVMSHTGSPPFLSTPLDLNYSAERSGTIAHAFSHPGQISVLESDPSLTLNPKPSSQTQADRGLGVTHVMSDGCNHNIAPNPVFRHAQHSHTLP